MTNLYVWLKFIHILSVGTFLFAHGVSGGASFLLRGRGTDMTHTLLRASQIGSGLAYPTLVLVIVTGVWMAFAGHWATQVWPWLALGVLILTMGAMGAFARPYYQARDAAKATDQDVGAKLASAKPELAAGVGVIALVILFFLMVFKPF